MGRARMPIHERTPFFCYVDECQNFITPSLAEILSGARKYGLGLVLAHQDLHQLQQCGDVAAAVMTNSATRIVFRVSEADGHALNGDFAHYEPKDFATLGRGEAICRIERADQDFNLRVIAPAPGSDAENETRRQGAIASSRRRNTVQRSAVEAALRGTTPTNAGQSSAPTRTSADAPKADSQQPPRAKLESAQNLRAPVVSSPSTEPNSDEGQNTVHTEPTAQGSEMPAQAHPSGKGGPRHVEIQQQLKRAGEAHGFRSIIEYPVGASGESIDLVFVKDALKIACEISVTTSPQDELRNAKKCLRQGFSTIVMASAESSAVESLRTVIERELSPIDSAKLKFMHAEDVAAFLAEAASTNPTTGENRVHGFKIRRTYAKIPAAERAAKMNAFWNLLAEEMKAPPPPT